MEPNERFHTKTFCISVTNTTIYETQYMKQYMKPKSTAFMIYLNMHENKQNESKFATL